MDKGDIGWILQAEITPHVMRLNAKGAGIYFMNCVCSQPYASAQVCGC